MDGRVTAGKGTEGLSSERRVVVGSEERGKSDLKWTVLVRANVKL